MNSKDTPDTISSQELDCGTTPSISLDGENLQSGLEAVPASPSPAPVVKKAKKTIDTFGPSGTASSMSYALQQSLESRLAARLPTGGLTMFIKGWKQKVTPLGRRYCQLAVSAHPIDESDCGLWQTPVADDCVEREKGKYNSRGEPKLSGQAALWATPKVSSGDYQKGKNGEKILNLSGQVRLWPTPRASSAMGDDVGTTLKNVENSMTRQDGKSRLDTVPRLAYGLDNGMNAQTGNRGSLNPEFVFWLMGIPHEWVSSIQRAMQSYRK